MKPGSDAEQGEKGAIGRKPWTVADDTDLDGTEVKSTVGVRAVGDEPVNVLRRSSHCPAFRAHEETMLRVARSGVRCSGCVKVRTIAAR